MHLVAIWHNLDVPGVSRDCGRSMTPTSTLPPTNVLILPSALPVRKEAAMDWGKAMFNESGAERLLAVICRSRIKKLNPY